MLGHAYINDCDRANVRGRGRELGRVGIAATMMVFGGTVIIILMTMALGHYNSLAHSGPKAVLDGAVIALLIGRRGRWRSLALLGVVYGLVLLMQVGVPYLPVVLAAAGLAGAAVGRSVSVLHRGAAVVLAAAAFEWAAGLGSPLKIYFGTADANEPFLWGLWMAEWPLRIGGAAVGALMAARWARGGEAEEACDAPRCEVARRVCDRRVRGVRPAAVRLAVLLAATAVPLALEPWSALAAVNGLVLVYALVLGPRGPVLKALLGVAWGYAVFAGASYLWHQDADRVVDLIRTFALRFAPMAMASMVLIYTVRPVDLVRVLRKAPIPGAGVVLLPLAVVLRQAPRLRRDVSRRFGVLREAGQWRGPVSLLRHPRAVLRELLWRPLRRFAGQLAE